MILEGPYGPSGESWAWSLGWETRTADGSVQPDATGVHEQIHAAPEGDPAEELFLTVTTPRIAGEAEIDRSDVPSPTTSTWCSDPGHDEAGPLRLCVLGGEPVPALTARQLVPLVGIPVTPHTLGRSHHRRRSGCSGPGEGWAVGPSRRDAQRPSGDPRQPAPSTGRGAVAWPSGRLGWARGSRHLSPHMVRRVRRRSATQPASVVVGQQRPTMKPHVNPGSIDCRTQPCIPGQFWVNGQVPRGVLGRGAMSRWTQASAVCSRSRFSVYQRRVSRARSIAPLAQYSEKAAWPLAAAVPTMS